MRLQTASRSPSLPADVGRRIIELACLAPSVHNTQPWSWQIDRNTITLHADFSRQLLVEDPLGRNLTISCGAALHHAQVAARILGWEPRVTRQPAGTGSPVLAQLELTRVKPWAADRWALAAMQDRCTDRRRFTAWPVPQERLARLAAESRGWGVEAVALTDVSGRFRAELLANRAYDAQSADPRVRAEQDSWVGRGDQAGIPPGALRTGPRSTARPMRFAPGWTPDLRPQVEGSDGLIVLGARSDDALAWLSTGEGLSALWLEATRQGLSVVPLSQPVEVEQTRIELYHDVLHGRLMPHLLLRIGWQPIGRSELPRTPRRPVDEVMRSRRGSGGRTS